MTLILKKRVLRPSTRQASSIAIIEEYKIDLLMSFDSHFDGIVERLG